MYISKLFLLQGGSRDNTQGPPIARSFTDAYNVQECHREDGYSTDEYDTPECYNTDGDGSIENSIHSFDSTTAVENSRLSGAFL